MVGEQSKGDPVVACAAAIEDYDWTKASKGTGGIHARTVKGSGERLAVTLSHGKRALLTRQTGRWVVDEIRR